MFNLNQQSIYDSDFYVISRNSGDGKGIRLHAWNTTEIKANYYNKIVFNYSDVLRYANIPDVAIFHITSLIFKERVQAFKDTAHRKFIDVTTGLCVIDIDDQALNPESELYDPTLDHSDHRYELSNKLLRMIECENGEIEQGYEVTVSTKGYHIVLQFTEEIMPLLNCKKLKLTDSFCEKYGITEQERKRADIDLLLMHQIKKAGQPLKPTTQHCKESVFYMRVPESMLERKEKDTEFNIFSKFQRPVQHNFKYMTDPNYIKYDPIPGAFRKYLQSIGITLPAGKEVQIPCIFHHETKPSLSINTDKNVFHCFGCDVKGNLMQFVQLQLGIDSKEALKILKELGCLK